jgi:hypothetical protein
MKEFTLFSAVSLILGVIIGFAILVIALSTEYGAIPLIIGFPLLLGVVIPAGMTAIIKIADWAI